jgi:DNA-binding NarL/FixJ family response regulator
VLAILCQGYSAPEIAVQLNVAVSTVRSHVRSLCAKTQSTACGRWWAGRRPAAARAAVACTIRCTSAFPSRGGRVPC